MNEWRHEEEGGFCLFKTLTRQTLTGLPLVLVCLFHKHNRTEPSLCVVNPRRHRLFFPAFSSDVAVCLS